MNETEIREQVKEAFGILMNAAKPEKGALIVLGCSTSEIVGKRIGSASTSTARFA